MARKQTIPSDRIALADNNGQRVGNGLPFPSDNQGSDDNDDLAATNRTKTDLLAALVADHEICEAIGPAWRLLMHLMLQTNGRMIGSYETIAETLGASPSTLRKWVVRLRDNDFLCLASKGQRIEMSLTEDYMIVAQAPNAMSLEIKDNEEEETPRIRAARKIVKLSEELGSQVEVKLVI